MLEIKANKAIYIDGKAVNIENNSIREILISSLGCPLILDKDLVLGDLIHVLYDIRDFINLYCCEEYEVGRTLINAGVSVEKNDYLKIFKSIEIADDNILIVNTQSTLCSYEDVGKIQNISNLKIVLDSTIVDTDEVLKNEIKVKSSFSLLEVIEVLYEDFLYSLKNDNILI